ncbi:hypothetical protein VP01_92g3 [Puccinia sorghi]|uniref:Uncharacterized protein n=1 Tax=Puccinia sorghi TaxID=27349 RepID=A0A0L6U709_9BASI|nr:hypothetical protein VP01_92g3 [Puccinia sorghi]
MISIGTRFCPDLIRPIRSHLTSRQTKISVLLYHMRNKTLNSFINHHSIVLVDDLVSMHSAVQHSMCSAANWEKVMLQILQDFASGRKAMLTVKWNNNATQIWKRKKNCYTNGWGYHPQLHAKVCLPRNHALSYKRGGGGGGGGVARTHLHLILDRLLGPEYLAEQNWRLFFQGALEHLPGHTFIVPAKSKHLWEAIKEPVSAYFFKSGTDNPNYMSLCLKKDERIRLGNSHTVVDAISVELIAKTLFFFCSCYSLVFPFLSPVFLVLIVIYLLCCFFIILSTSLKLSLQSQIHHSISFHHTRSTTSISHLSSNHHLLKSPSSSETWPCHLLFDQPIQLILSSFSVLFHLFLVFFQSHFSSYLYSSHSMITVVHLNFSLSRYFIHLIFCFSVVALLSAGGHAKKICMTQLRASTMPGAAGTVSVLAPNTCLAQLCWAHPLFPHPSRPGFPGLCLILFLFLGFPQVRIMLHWRPVMGRLEFNKQQQMGYTSMIYKEKRWNHIIGDNGGAVRQGGDVCAACTKGERERRKSGGGYMVLLGTEKVTLSTRSTNACQISPKITLIYCIIILLIITNIITLFLFWGGGKLFFFNVCYQGLSCVTSRSAPARLVVCATQGPRDRRGSKRDKK